MSDVAAILDVAALPRELVQVNGVNLIRCSHLHIHTPMDIFRKQIGIKNNICTLSDDCKP